MFSYKSLVTERNIYNNHPEPQSKNALLDFRLLLDCRLTLYIASKIYYLGFCVSAGTELYCASHYLHPIIYIYGVTYY